MLIDMSEKGPQPGVGLSTIHCVKCDYNLTGLSMSVCPSCGTRFAPEGAEPRYFSEAGFLHAMGVIYLLTGLAPLLVMKSAIAVAILGMIGTIGQPISILFLSYAYSGHLIARSAREPRPGLRVFYGLILFVGLTLLSAGAWALTLRGMNWDALQPRQ